MKSHSSSLASRILRAALRVSHCRYRVVAVGIDHRHRIIGLTTNTPRLSTRGWHAEERLLHRAPRSLRRITIARVGADGTFLPIDPCAHCRKLAKQKGVEIVRYHKH